MPSIARPLASPPSHGWLVESLLREQQELPAVARFSQWHDDGPVQHISSYRDLIPLTQPGPGEQFAFEVDLNACSGCKACVTACHSLNGLEEEETWRSVGLLQGKVGGQHTLKYVTTACHHCLEPACLQGCPTKAYEKDPVTGIVRHLDDQCFGCQYCVLMCPYEVPKYSSAKGIVRKCDMCRQRLANDEAPACVQACPSQAIKIRVVSNADTLARARSNDFLPSAPDSQLTQPTTRFLGAGELSKLSSDVWPGDHAHHSPAHAHWPLVFMLVLTQSSLGMLALGHLLTFWLQWLPASPGHVLLSFAAAATGVIGANLAALHLGRPQIAYRAWLGWRTSWLSREVVAFGVYLPLLMLSAAISLSSSQSFHVAVAAFEFIAVLAGIAAVYCSAQIYAATRRIWWKSSETLMRFALTAYLMGSATCETIIVATAPTRGTIWHDYRIAYVLIVADLIVVAVRTAAEARFLRSAPSHLDQALRSTGELLADRPLRYSVRRRRFFALSSAVGLPLLAVLMMAALPDSAVLRAVLATIFIARISCFFAAETLERYLFFAACAPPRMPGGLH